MLYYTIIYYNIIVYTIIYYGITVRKGARGRSCSLPERQSEAFKIHQRGVQWKQGAVTCMMLYTDLLYNTTPIHCTPFPLHPPVMNTQVCRTARAMPSVGRKYSSVGRKYRLVIAPSWHRTLSEAEVIAPSWHRTPSDSCFLDFRSFRMS